MAELAIADENSPVLSVATLPASILQKRLEKAKQEYIQLQTNMEFFSRSSSENPLVNKVAKDIEKQKRIIDELEKKKAFFRNL